ncbi:MAG: ankyrin repeat domain-containing protein [Candidatus Babeliales bacterium]
MNRLSSTIVMMIAFIFLLPALVLSDDNANLKKQDYETMLFQAAKDGDLVTLKRCVGLVDFNIYDELGFLPLHHALFNYHWDVMTFLVLHGANINMVPSSHPVAAEIFKGLNPNYRVSTVLQYAVDTGDIGIVRFLIALGADTTVTTGSSVTPYKRACVGKHKEICEILKAHGAYTVFEAAYFDDLEMVQKFLPVCANATTVEGKTLLHIAAESGSLRMIQLLLDSGANINALDDYGYSPFHRAIEKLNTKVVNFLIEKGADIYAPAGTNKLTPLHIAAKGNWLVLGDRIEMIKILLNAGVQLTGRDREGKTPYDLACTVEGESQEEITRFLHALTTHTMRGRQDMFYEEEKINLFVEECVNPYFLHEKLSLPQLESELQKYKNTILTYKMPNQMWYGDKVLAINETYDAITGIYEELTHNRELMFKYLSAGAVSTGILLAFGTVAYDYLKSNTKNLGISGIALYSAFTLLGGWCCKKFIQQGLNARKRYAIYQELREIQKNTIKPALLASVEMVDQANAYFGEETTIKPIVRTISL